MGMGLGEANFEFFFDFIEYNKCGVQFQKADKHSGKVFPGPQLSQIPSSSLSTTFFCFIYFSPPVISTIPSIPLYLPKRPLFTWISAVPTFFYHHNKKKIEGQKGKPEKIWAPSILRNMDVSNKFRAELVESR